MKKNIKKLLVSTHLHTRGFILIEVLILLSFIFSYEFYYIHAINQKIMIEKDLIEIKQQKCIELLLYSYFYYDPSSKDETYLLEDYEIIYHVEEMDDKSYLTAKIIKDDFSYEMKLMKKGEEIEIGYSSL